MRNPWECPFFRKKSHSKMTPELDLATISFPFNNILASFRLSINSCVFINIPGGSVFNFPRPFVFIYIPGGSFIFNISLLGQLPPPLVLNGTWVRRNDGRRLESTIVCMNIAVSSFEAIRMV